jgi:hypothetical protein
MHKWGLIVSLGSGPGGCWLHFETAKGQGMQVEQSVLTVATEEQKHLEKHLELLGDTYDLTTLLESLYGPFPPNAGFPWMWRPILQDMRRESTRISC